MTPAAFPTPEDLPALHPDEVAARRALLHWRSPDLDASPALLSAELAALTGLDVRLDAGDLVFMEGARAVEVSQHGHGVALGCAGDPFGALTVEVEVMLAALDASFGRSPDPARRLRPLSPAEQGLSRAALAAMAARLSAHLGVDLHLSAAQDTPQPLQEIGRLDQVAVWRLEIAVGPVQGRAWALARPDALMKMLSGGPPARWRPAPLLPWLGRVAPTTAATLELGRFDLSAEALAGLEVGGLIVGALDLAAPDQASPAAASRVALTLRSGDRAVARLSDASTAAHPDQWRLAAPTAPRITPKEHESMSDEGSIDVRALPVEVTLELGRVSVPLDALARMKPGDVLELGQPLQRPVAIMVGGRRVGQGELVRVGEALAVRVTAIDAEGAGAP